MADFRFSVAKRKMASFFVSSSHECVDVDISNTDMGRLIRFKHILKRAPKNASSRRFESVLRPEYTLLLHLHASGLCSLEQSTHDYSRSHADKLLQYLYYRYRDGGTYGELLHVFNNPAWIMTGNYFGMLHQALPREPMVGPLYVP